MYRKHKITAIVAIAVAMAFIMPVAAVANVGTIGVTSNSENTGDIEIMVESTTNSDISDNIETTSDAEKPVIDIKDTKELTIVNDARDIVSATGRTIYVDDDRPSEWYNETQVRTIQEGVNNASAEDTVYVYNGTYRERVTVTKQLDLIGGSRENVVVDGSGSGNVLYITTPVTKVNISTFTITNGSYGIYLKSSSDNIITNCNVCNNENNGIYLYMNSDNNIITNCDAYNNKKYGISLHSSSDNSIINCNAYSNYGAYGAYYYGCGIHLSRSSNCKLRDNTIYDNDCNFFVEGKYDHNIDTTNTANGKPIHYIRNDENLTFDESYNIGYLALISCTNITVKNVDMNGILMAYTTNSTIDNVDSHTDGYGIYLDQSSNNNIINCDLYNNVQNGIHLYRSSKNNITNCDLYNNTKYSIYIRDHSDKNSITNCDVYNNNYFGIYLATYSNNNNILDCDVYNNKGVGIQFQGSSNSNAINCNVYNNSGSSGGIFIWGSSNCNITKCNTYNNKNYGIRILVGSDNNIMSCNIHDNSRNGIHIDASPGNTLRGNVINNNVYNFGVDGDLVTDFNQDIDASNTVDGRSIWYLVDEKDIILDETDNFGYLALIRCTNVMAKNSDTSGIVMMETTDSTVSNITIHDSISGIFLHSCSNCIVTECNVQNSGEGFLLYSSSYCNITKCDISGNMYGIYIDSSSNCKLSSNTLYDNEYNFVIHSTVTEDFVHDIDTSNMVDGKPMQYLVDQENITLDGTLDNFGYLALISCTNITAKNADVTGIIMVDNTDSTISNVDTHNSKVGFYIRYSSGNNIINCNTYNNSEIGIYISESSNNNNFTNCNVYNNNKYGISLYRSLNDNFTNCDISNNNYGIYAVTYSSGHNFLNCNIHDNAQMGFYAMAYVDDNSIINCNIYNHKSYGIYLSFVSEHNVIHHNNFVNNSPNACTMFCYSETWDDGSEGNYWDDYNGVDEDGDGIGDTPYLIPWVGGVQTKDNYPLMMIIDDIPPEITNVQATPEAQTTTDPVNITCTVIDNWDMVDTVKINITGPEGFALEATMSEGSYYYEDTYATMGVYHYFIWANDTLGNIAVSDFYSFVITDLYLPISAVDPLPTWKTMVPFTVTATAFDNTGVANVTLWSRYSSDGTDWTEWTSYGIDEEALWSWEFTGSDGYYEFYSIAVDDYGNIEEPPDPLVADASTGTDTVKPVTTIVLDGTIGENNWFTSNATVTLSATDDTSGVGSTWYQIDSGSPKIYTIPFTVSSNGEHIIQYYSFDNAINREDTKSVDIKIDTIVPVTDHEFDGVIGKEGWFVGDVMVTLSAIDAMSGVNYTMYELNDDGWITYVEPFMVTENGDHTLCYYSVDLAGKTEPTNEVNFKIEHDTVPPETTHAFDGIQGENDWFTTNVAVTLSAEDDTAGVDYTMYKLDEGEWIKYTGSFLVTEDDVHTLRYYSVDKVGNNEAENEVELKIDKTVPTIELTWDKENSKLVADVDDETSGVAKVEFYVNGKFVGEDTTSPYEWEVTKPKKGDMGQAIVYDNAGNKAISPEIDAVSQSQSQSSSSSSVPWPFSWLLGLW